LLASAAELASNSPHPANTYLNFPVIYSSP
jgi:hypothetical protein